MAYPLALLPSANDIQFHLHRLVDLRKYNGPYIPLVLYKSFEGNGEVNCFLCHSAPYSGVPVARWPFPKMIPEQ